MSKRLSPLPWPHSSLYGSHREEAQTPRPGNAVCCCKGKWASSLCRAPTV